MVAPACTNQYYPRLPVIEKRKVSLPDIVHGIIRCGNPKCITNNEPMETIFHVTDKIDVQVKCHYCERSVTKRRNRNLLILPIYETKLENPGLPSTRCRLFWSVAVIRPKSITSLR